MIRKLRFFSTVLQSLLSFRLYAPYQKSVQKNFEYLYDTTMKTRKISSNEQKIDDNSERYEISINGRPNFVAIPSDLELVYKKQINRIHCLVLAHRCWEEAENRRNPKDSGKILILRRISSVFCKLMFFLKNFTFNWIEFAAVYHLRWTYIRLSFIF